MQKNEKQTSSKYVGKGKWTLSIKSSNNLFL